jgi:tRNA1Val (adenine37-N6)-methyltransferase
MQLDPGVETLDNILGGRLALIQPISGYRFAIDSILLGSFARPRRTDRLLELGAGCGVIAAMITLLRQPREVVAIELQPPLAAIAQRNVMLNRLAHFTALQADLRAGAIDGIAPASFDYVVANPPYRAPHCGRESPNAGRRLARGSGGATLREFIAAAARYVVEGGRFALIFTASRSAELIAELRSKSFEPKRCRFVHPYADRPATLILIEARKGGGAEVAVEAPLILWERSGVYTAHARAILSGDQAGAIALL